MEKVDYKNGSIFLAYLWVSKSHTKRYPVSKYSEHCICGLCLYIKIEMRK